MNLIKFADKSRLFGGGHGIDPIIDPNESPLQMGN
jgi:hypothetical protein